MLLDIVHTTCYSYDDPVAESVMEARLEPRSGPEQRLVNFALRCEPPTETFSYRDGFGNAVHLVTLLRPLAGLTLTARSRVETLLDNPFVPPERQAAAPDEVDLWLFRQAGGPVTLTPAVRALAERFRPAGPDRTLPALQDLMLFIYDGFSYEAAVTTVSSTVADLLALRRGVCQDFAHLMIAVCRAMGIPARYVSGYILSRPERAARGSGASHAWCEALVPGFGWRGFDPTNAVLAAGGHVKVAIGRDYRDVPPTRGVYRGIAREQMTVSVETLVADPGAAG